MSRIRIHLVTLLVVALPSWAFATPISVGVLPPNPSESDSISLQTTLTWGTSGYSVFDSLTISTGPFDLLIQIFVSSPAPDEIVLQVVTYEDLVSPLGLLPAGTYSYTVNEIDVQRGTGFQTLAGSLSGTFSVIPEPSSSVLVLLGLCGLAIGRSVKRRRRAATARALRLGRRGGGLPRGAS
jgi:hypothetical protein